VLTNASKIPLNDTPKEYNLALERLSNIELKILTLRNL
jgi:hypothetical protein